MSDSQSPTQEIMNRIEAAKKHYEEQREILKTLRYSSVSDEIENLLAVRKTLFATVEKHIASLISYRHGLIVAQYAGTIDKSDAEVMALIIEVDEAIQDLSTQFCDLVKSARKLVYR